MSGFNKDHWRDPRASIATRYRHDDFAYATHGALVAMECVRRLEIPGSKAQHMNLLDYGAGTGRIGRVLAGFFGRVTCYDPVEEPIAQGKLECKVPQHNVIYTSSLDDLAWKGYEVVISVNVIEHLNLHDQQEMLNIIKGCAKPGASLLLWYNVRNNRVIMKQFFPGNWDEEDEIAFASNPDQSINVRLFQL